MKCHVKISMDTFIESRFHFMAFTNFMAFSSPNLCQLNFHDAIFIPTIMETPVISYLIPGKFMVYVNTSGSDVTFCETKH